MFRCFLLTDLAPIKALSKALTSIDHRQRKSNQLSLSLKKPINFLMGFCSIKGAKGWQRVPKGVSGLPLSDRETQCTAKILSSTICSSGAVLVILLRGWGNKIGKSSPILPCSIKITLSAVMTASLTSWVTKITVNRCSCHNLTNSCCISRRVNASSAPNGSSSSNSWGR